MAAYLDGHHHPQQALAARVAYVAVADARVVGYAAGHATTRYGCDGEVQYLYVAPGHRRSGVARALVRALAEWFVARQIRRVCVNADIDGPGAVAFYTAAGAHALNRYWYVWPDIADVVDGPAAGTSRVSR